MVRKPELFSSPGLYPQYQSRDQNTAQLAGAILAQALRDLFSPRKVAERDWQKWQEDSREWFLSDQEIPGSFYWVCENINIEPAALRNWVFKLEEKEQASRMKTLGSVFRFATARCRR